MKDKVLNIYKFISQVLIIFSVTILFITLNGLLIGDSAKEYSTLFSLGSVGIEFKSVLQILITSVVITVINNVFLSDKIFKNMLSLWKMILSLLFIFITIVIFIICFKWFPITLTEAWIGFLVSFGGFFVVSSVIMITKTNREAKKYDELLETYKKRYIEEVGCNDENN